MFPPKPTKTPMPKCPPPTGYQTKKDLNAPPGTRRKTNPFDTSSVTLTKLEWRYILHTLRLCNYNPEAEEAFMNEHCRKLIEEASE